MSADTIWSLMEEWRLCRPAMLDAIAEAKGTHSEDDVLVELMVGRMKLWRRNASGLVTEFCQFPRIKCINVFLAGGDLADILPLQSDIENFGRRNGCRRATMLAVRPGWRRVIGGNVGAGTYLIKDL
jgi:hypothetical protein